MMTKILKPSNAYIMITGKIQFYDETLHKANMVKQSDWTVDKLNII